MILPYPHPPIPVSAICLFTICYTIYQPPSEMLARKLDNQEESQEHFYCDFHGVNMSLRGYTLKIVHEAYGKSITATEIRPAACIWWYLPHTLTVGGWITYLLLLYYIHLSTCQTSLTLTPHPTVDFVIDITISSSHDGLIKNGDNDEDAHYPINFRCLKPAPTIHHQWPSPERSLNQSMDQWIKGSKSIDPNDRARDKSKR